MFSLLKKIITIGKIILITMAIFIGITIFYSYIQFRIIDADFAERRAIREAKQFLSKGREIDEINFSAQLLSSQSESNLKIFTYEVASREPEVPAVIVSIAVRRWYSLSEITEKR